MKRPLILGVALVACVTVTVATSSEANTQRPASPSKLVVLDVELSGDLGDPELVPEHLARLELANAKLRESLSRTGLYQLVDSTAARSTIDELKSQYLYLHDCNGCDLDIARQLGADQVLVVWVNRVSALILSLTYEFHDVETGQITARKSFGFRGDNDTSWTRAIDYMVRDLDESATTRSSETEDARAQSDSKSDSKSLETRADEVFSSLGQGGPGCAAGVIKQGELIYAKGFGNGDLEHRSPLTADSIFYIASTSKQFTAASVALLILQNRIALDDDIRRYVPEMPNYGVPITVRNLIHHTSGIRDYFELAALAGHGDDSFDNAFVVRLIARQKTLVFSPGSRFLYSNSNYVLLAEIVSRVAGVPMSTVAQERIFLPLGMTKTEFGTDLGKIVPNRASSYGKRADGEIFQFTKTIRAYGDGNLLTSIRDLARWDANFYSGSVGGSALIDLMRTRGSSASGSGHYAFGLQTGTYRGLAFEDHGGAYLGYRTQMVRFPQQRTTAIVLCNYADANPGKLALEVIDIYLADELGQEPPERVSPKRQQPAEIKFKPEDFDAYAGAYVMTGPGPRHVITFTRERQRFYGQFFGGPRVEIFPYSASKFFAKIFDAQASFHRERDGSVRRATLHQNGDHDAIRLSPVSFGPTGLAKYAGDYYSDELDVFYRVIDKEGQLELADAQRRTTVLIPIERNAFVCPSAELRFEEDSGGSRVAFTYVSSRDTSIRFVKVQR
jgi:CubicO group peptidase (beta-lactamase class C family)